MGTGFNSGSSAKRGALRAGRTRVKRFRAGRARLHNSAAAAAFLLLFAAASPALAQPYADAVGRWTAQDALDPIAPGAVVFVGSSSIRRWEELALDFADYRIVQRGFGGARFGDVNFWVDELVVDLQPAMVVVWAGTNDVSAGESGLEVFGDYQTFVAAVHGAEPAVEIVYLGITPTPANEAFRAPREDANARIAQMASADGRLHYVDLPAAFDALDPPSDPAFLSLYVDPVHLNRAGYDLWSSIIRPAVGSIVAPNKTAASNPDTLAVGERLLMDFGPGNPQDGDPTPSPDARGLHWNNWHAAEGNVAVNAGERLADLVDTAGGGTGVRLTVTGGFSTNGKVNGGLLNPDPALLGDLAVATATQDYFFSGADGLPGGGNDDIPGGFMLDGLDPAGVYELRLFGSRRLADATRTTEYRVTGANEVVAELTTTGRDIGSDGSYDGNDDAVALAGGVRPDAFGQVFVDMTVLTGAFAYVNAMEVRRVSASVAAEPADIAVDAGTTLVLSAGVEVDASAGASLRWRRDGAELSDGGRIGGAATATLTVASAGPEDAGVYELVATTVGGSVATRGAIVGVRAVDDADVNRDGSVDQQDLSQLLGALSGP